MLDARLASSMLKAMFEQDKDVRSRVDVGVRQLIFLAGIHDGYAHASSVFDPTAPERGVPEPENEAHARLGDLKRPVDRKYRPGPASKVDRLEHLMREKARINSEMLRLASDALPYEPPPDSARCIGSGEAEGSTCTQWGWFKAGRCHDCHKVSEAARIRQLRRERA